MLVPKLRFKREAKTYYPEWSSQKLSAVASRVNRKNKGNITDIPLTIASLYGLVDQREYFKKTIASQNMEGYYLLNNGEFAYNKSYSKGFDFGAIKRLDKYDCGALSTLYICFAVNDKVNSDFMTHYFDSQKWNKEVSIRCAEGARNHGLLNISTDDFFDINIVLPTELEEQQKIAEFLSTVDEVIMQSEAEVQKLEQQKKAAMQKIFSRESRFKRDDGVEYPVWDDCILSDYCKELKTAIDPQKYPDDNFYEYSMPAFDVDKKPNSVLGRDMNSNRKIVSTSCVLINKLNVRKKRIWKVIKPAINSVCSAEFIPVTSEKISIDFLEHLALSDSFTARLLDCSTGTSNSQKRVTPDIIMDMPVSIPCLEEQQKIANFLSAFDEAIGYAKQELEKWKELKKGLLQQMFV